MMLMADDHTSFWSGADIASGDDLESGGDEFTIGEEDFGLSIDLDSLFSILEEDPNPPQQNNPEDSSFRNVSQGDSTSNIGSHENFLFTKGLQKFEGPPPVGTDLPGPNTSFLSYNLEASDSRTGGSDCFLQSDGNFHSGISGQIGSSVQMLHPERQYEIHNCSKAFTFAAGDVNHIPDYLGNADFCHRRGDFDSNYTSYGPVVQNSDISRRNHGISMENSMETFHAPEHNSCISTETSSQNASGSVPVCQAPETVCETSNCYPDLQYCGGMGDIAFVDSLRQYPSDNFSIPFIPTNEEMTINIKDEQEFSTGSVCFSSEKISEAQFGKSSRHVPMMSATDNYDVKGFNYEHGNYSSPFSGRSFSNVSDRPINARGLTEPLTRAQPCTSSLKQEACGKDERSDVLFTPNSSFEVMDEAVSKKLPGVDDSLLTEKDRKKSLHYFRPSMSIYAKDEQEDVFLASERSPNFTTVLDETVNNNPTDGECSAVHSAARHSSCFQQPTFSKEQSVYIKDEKEGNLIHPKSIRPPLSNVSSESIQSNSSDQKSYVDDDADICILEDISIPPRSNASLSHGKSIVSSQRTASCGPLYHNGVGGVKLKANDERLIFRLALQDLSQPKLEANPPDGLLAVPLLRHQKIALSWMAQKETVNMFCSGGILADDQGLGKTISTIALILKERPPSSAICQNGIKHGESEMLNLDDDDDNVLELDGIKCGDASVQARGRPAAGTLVVCPTSVLRQWAEELQNKVTSKANLSVLVYHGSNRTKDPCELAEYDVVLTTYSIVSMEVPKQPLVDKDDDERRKRETNVTPTMGLNSSRKRKFPPSSGKGGSNHKKGVDIAFLESAARPLARVVWFRVVLDEAQSIKNHRTQVARACWGLRAKRRWCLSGTPIQNAVDDLYSYFRFLKYDPYAVYKTFCSTIKVPINRNPANGYRKLQAVLRTIMLRRTKGTLLDGEPIITLPPKFVELKKVDFSKEERHFYSRLEADSRAQFEEYAAAGTVKQNYVNILLMLLRLRQACDHPLLVRGYNSNSVWRSSVETAKKLPLEKQNNLLTCLEASLAICGICNDPPEDAVVSVCGHVFCNQCICEHLTGDDSQCPNGNCKVQLTVSSVFSKLTLKSSLADQSVLDGSPDSSGSELVNALDPGGLSCDSSKIKAALEVLQSLSKPQNCMASSSLKSLDETASYLEETTNLNSGGVDRDISRERNTVVDKDLKDPIKLVGEKAIVFSQWTRMLDLLEACLKNSSIQYRRLDGTMSVVARDKAVKDFNTLPEVSVMIMSLKAASLGLNMVAACHVVLLDLWWNPTTEDQAIDRAHRIGQTRAVTVLRLTVKDTVEDRILALQQKKREMVASAFGEDESGSLQTRLTVEDLKYLFMV